MGGIMRLKNKKTGEIAELRSKQQLYEDEPHLFLDTKNGRRHYTSLAELNEEWEDYEEPKKYYYINDIGAIQREEVGKCGIDELARKEIGNYFESEEEAEKAVKKIEAWKRLKDKGFRFKGWTGASGSNNQVVYCDFGKADASLLDLLFGGEE